MYHFEVYLKETGEVLEKGRPSDWQKIRNWLSFFTDEEKEMVNFFVKGAKVTFDDMMEECWNKEDEFMADKKWISVQAGYLPTTRKWVLVRK